MSECIIILHGIFRTNRSMHRLSHFLEAAGYKILNLTYPSTKHDLEKLAEIIHPQVSDFSAGAEKVHFVGFSMGGLLIRAYLKKYRPQNLGRVVMIGTPNKGSEIADFLKNFFLYKLIYGPAGQQLITDQQGFSHIFGDIDFELGIIAGNKSFGPFSSKINKPNDGKVSIESALLADARDTVIISSSHTFFPTNRQMWKQTLAFLKTASFD